MAKTTVNIDEQVAIVAQHIPDEPTDYQTFVDSLGALGVTEPTRAITLLKQRKQVKLAVGRDENGRYFRISKPAPANEGGE